MGNRPVAAEATSEGQAEVAAAEGASSCKEVAVVGTEEPGEACCEGQHQVQAASYGNGERDKRISLTEERRRKKRRVLGVSSRQREKP